MGLPSSVVMAVAISSARRPMISSALNITAARPGAGVFAQPDSASRAAVTARPASSALEVWNSPTTCSLWAGL